MFHERERFTYKGHVVSIGIEAVRQSSVTNGKDTPVFLKTPVVYIDNIKIPLNADRGRSVQEPLEVVARKIIEEMPPPAARTPQPVAATLLFRPRGEYWRERGKRIGLNLMGGGLLVTACGLAMLAILPFVLFLVLLAQFLSGQHGSDYDAGLLFSGMIFLLVGGFAGGCGWFGLKSMKQAKQIVPGVPLTRANTGDLPASESLVRASEEPVQEHQAVLLRAVAEGQETPPEQLVRAVNGQE